MIAQPVSIYNNWSSYDELSDSVELDEKLGLRQLDEMIRMRGRGVRFDYYMMDAFWFARDGAYRTWRQPHWPNGPDKWLAECKKNGIKPGLWFSSNSLTGISPAENWRDSLDANATAMCMFTGGFLPDFMQALQEWYDRGVRGFKFDFIQFDAATTEIKQTHLPEEIRRTNAAALKAALRVFRHKNPDVLLQGYNGLGGLHAGTFEPFRKSVDTDWLTVFDSLYSGDARLADVPTMSFWRSMDIYSDHMVRQYFANGIPLERIDNAAFMAGTTGTCYGRGTAAWKGMLLLSLARGGWANVYYGDLSLFDDEAAEWFAMAQRIYMGLQAVGRTHNFGGVPGNAESYGWASFTGCLDALSMPAGAVYTVVNPTQGFAEVSLPRVCDWQAELSDGRILFTDAGFGPRLSGDTISLGPEQMAVVGFGLYASDAYDLGVQDDVIIPRAIRPISAVFESRSPKIAATDIKAPAGVDIRITMRHVDSSGCAVRTSGGCVGDDRLPLDRVLRISASQDGKPVPVRIHHDRPSWSGISWAAGEISSSDLAPNKSLAITCETTDPRDVRLECSVYAVNY